MSKVDLFDMMREMPQWHRTNVSGQDERHEATWIGYHLAVEYYRPEDIWKIWAKRDDHKQKRCLSCSLADAMAYAQDLAVMDYLLEQARAKRCEPSHEAAPIAGHAQALTCLIDAASALGATHVTMGIGEFTVKVTR